MSGALAAGFWGLVGGSAMVLGAAIAYLAPVPPRVVAVNRPGFVGGPNR